MTCIAQKRHCLNSLLLHLVLNEVESQVDNFKQITVFQFVNLIVDSVPSFTGIQFWVLANRFLGGWGEGGCGISLHTMADLGNLRSCFFFSGKTRKSYKSEEGPPDCRLQPWLFHCLQIHCLTNGSKYSHTKKKCIQRQSMPLWLNRFGPTFTKVGAVFVHYMNHLQEYFF